MKFVAFVLSLFLVSSAFGQQENDTLTTIEYRITSTSDDQFIINYNDERQQFMGATGLSGWTYSIKTNKKPFTATLVVNKFSTKITNPETTLQILVNGTLAKTITGKPKISKGGLKIQYVVK